METKYRIGYIDENEKQVKKFTRNLRPCGFEVVGYEFSKDMSPESLMDQVYESDIDLLMIDYKLKESNIVSFNGDEIEHLIYNTKPLFPHIIFTSDVDQAEAHVEDWKIIFDKGNLFTEDKADEATERFVKTLTRSIEQYKNYVARKKKALEALLFKGDKEGLSVKEKSDALIIQNELNSLDKSKQAEIPQQLIAVDNLEALAKSRKEAEDFLQSLIDNKE